MRVFLTGGTGFIGQALARLYSDRALQLDALVRRPESAPALYLASLGATLIAGDVTQRESMRAAIARADLVIHNAGVYEFGADAALRRRMQAANVDGTDNTLGLALELGKARSIYVSTALATGSTGVEPRDETFVRQVPCLTAYEQSKTDAHEIALRVRERGLPLIIVCPNQVVGPNDHSVFGYLLRMYLLYLLPPLACNPGAILSPVHVQALAEGVALAAEKGRTGENYLLCGEPTVLRQLSRVLEAAPRGLHPHALVAAGVDEGDVRADGTAVSPGWSAGSLFSRNGRHWPLRTSTIRAPRHSATSAGVFRLPPTCGPQIVERGKTAPGTAYRPSCEAAADGRDSGRG